ncbi:succinylglutamate desuccinylase/aspartoacylase family protein [Candidatus Uhrbacteria bacterium]|nr:succinylglutamate desuccinylase/aspartoacylase family protein [Candidatus Uhrbacteria bacterium]
MNLPAYFWHVHSNNPSGGPKVMVLGGTHGDEHTGLWVVHHLLKKFGIEGAPCGSYQANGMLGDLYIGIGNPEAVLRGVRGVSIEKDLNRCFEPMVMDSPANTFHDVMRARELFPLLCQMDYLFDIHAVSNPKASPFVCFGKMTPEHRRLCDLIPVRHILTDPDNILPTDDPGSQMLSTTDAVVDRNGGTAITYETGFQSDASKLPRAIRVLVRLLCGEGAGVIDDRLARHILKGVKYVRPTMPDQRVFALTHCLVARSTDLGFEHGKKSMLKNWHPVCKGERYGRYTDDGEVVLIPADGFIVFPTKPDRMKPNKAMVYIARAL